MNKDNLVKQIVYASEMQITENTKMAVIREMIENFEKETKQLPEKPHQKPIEVPKTIKKATPVNRSMKHQRWNKHALSIVKKMFKEGKSDDTIARFMDRTPDSITMVRFKYGWVVRFRSRDKNKFRKAHKHNESNDRMLSFMGKRTAQLIKTGMTRKDASRKAGDEYKLIKTVQKAQDETK
jgi:hypothetical protein